MKKAILSFLVISAMIYIGCEKDFDAVIDQDIAIYQVINVSTLDSVYFVPGDSLILISITFNSTQDLRNVYTDIYASDGTKLNQNPFSLFDNGRTENGDLTANDNIYSNKFPLSQFYPNGTYTIRYFIEDKNNHTKQVAIQTFNYNNGQSNIPPIISNLTIPDTVARNVSFIFSVFAVDSNGLNDIEFVYFELFRPDSSQVFPSLGATKFIMHDDGNFDVYGDQIVGDGIFSFKNYFDTTAQIGKWKFVFQAIDRGKKLSNSITHFMQVQ